MASGDSDNHNSVYLVGIAILFIAAIITLSLSRFNTARGYVHQMGSLEHALRARGLLGGGTADAEEIAVEPLPLYTKYPTGSQGDVDALPNSRPPSFRSQIVPAAAAAVAVAPAAVPDAPPPDFDAAQELPRPPPAAYTATAAAASAAGVDPVAAAAEPHQHAVWTISAAEVQAALGASNRASVDERR
ncbi:hypothetical protein HDU90_007556 [Geranomyces variabilis]|nr:hypothetical protein HDU90_007556 [Geranomyces variabilis]